MKFTKDIHRTLVDALKTEIEEWGESAETVNARLWLEEVWPSLENCPDGVDIFAGRYEVTGNEKPLL